MSFLRSHKSFRLAHNFVKLTALKSKSSRDFSINKYGRILCSPTTSNGCDSIYRNYATQKTSMNDIENLLRKLDADVRRIGRINRRDIDSIISEVKLNKDITSVQALMIIGCFGDLLPEELPKTRTALVDAVWKILIKNNVPMDISHYNALLLTYIQNQHPFSPEEFMKEIENKGLQPNRVTYQRLMWRYCQTGDVEGATKILEKMRDLALPVSEPVLNALVMGHAFHGDTEGARAVLETMAVAGLQPSGRTYSLLACGFAKNGDLNGVKQIIDECEKKEIDITDKDLMDIIEHLAVSGKVDNIDYFIEKMEKGPGYNQNAINLSIRMINIGQENVAINVLKTLPKPSNLDGKSSPFRCTQFVRQLVYAGRPTDVVINMCKEMQKDDLAPLALRTATEAALYKGNVHLSLCLFKELKDAGMEIRSHFYWPLLVQKAKENDEEGVIFILRSMIADGVSVTNETLYDYVIPILNKKNNVGNVILKIQGAGISSYVAARNVVKYLLDQNDLKNAAKVAVDYSPWGQLQFFTRSLIGSLNHTKDVESFTTILHVICGGQQTQKETLERETVDDESDITENKNDPRSAVGYIVFGAVRALRTPESIDHLFKSLLNKGIGISAAYAEKIQDFLGEKMTIVLSQNLSKLTSSDLELTPIESRRPRLNIKTSAQLEQTLKYAKEKGNNIGDIQKQLISAYVREDKEEALLTLLNELEQENFVLTNNTLAQLIEYFSDKNSVDKALHYFSILTTREPDYSLNSFKVLKLANALIKADRYNDAIDILNKCKSETAVKQSFLYNSLCWQLLNQLAEAGDEQKLNELTELMFDLKYAEPSNILLGPLVKIHMLKDNIDAAINVFESCCRKYRCTPWKSELTRKLILAKDAEKLQHVTDLSTDIHGEVNSLYDLVFGFVECGRLVQARRILETPGLRSRTQRLNFACDRYLQEGKTEYLEGLLEATKKLSHIDRSNIFESLLQSYIKNKETDKALGLWTLLQEEGELPSEKFLLQLSEHLKSENRDIPFVVPENSETKAKKPIKSISRTNGKNTDFTKAIEECEVNKIIEIGCNAKSTDGLSSDNYSKAIMLLVEKNKLKDASDIAINSLKNNSHPSSRAMKYLLKRLSEEADSQTIHSIGDLLSEKQKRKFTFDNKLTQAKISGGSAIEHLEDLEQRLHTSSDENLKFILKSFPTGNSLAKIMEHPAYLNKCQSLAEQVAEKGFTMPMNLLWMEYVLQGEYNKADEIWSKYLKKSNLLMFGRLLNKANELNKPEILEYLMKVLKQNENITQNTKAHVYSKLIDCFIKTNDESKAKHYLEEALSSNITIKDLNKTSVLRLKNFIQSKGGEFNYVF